jgi:hypothetical protein
MFGFFDERQKDFGNVLPSSTHDDNEAFVAQVCRMGIGVS